MCSISWVFHDDGYELVFNRDEKWVRPLSKDPTFETQHRVPGFCARDGQANGTWLFTGETGLTLAVFNAYPEGALMPSGRQTRGQIPLLAGEAESAEALVELLQHKNYEAFAPFDLLLLNDSGTRFFGWDGRVFREKVVGSLPFLSSSSVGGARVIATRRKRFEQIRDLPLVDILSDTEAQEPEAAIYVTRDDGGTVSQTSVRVSQREVEFSVARRGEERNVHVIPRRSLLVPG